MKAIKYQLCTEVNHGTEDTPDIQQIFSAVTLGWSEANEKIAQSEAYNGEVTVEDVPDEPREPTQEEQLRADVDFLAVMTGVTL